MKKSCTALLLSTCMLLPVVASGADLKAELAQCAATMPDAQRLTCYDRLAAEPVTQAGASDDAGLGKWVVEVKISPIDDSRNVSLTLAASTPVQGPTGQYTPTLVARCAQRQLAVYVAYRQFLGSSARMPVLLRFDKWQAETVQWTTTTDNQGVGLFGVSGVPNLLQQLLQAQTLLVQITPVASNPLLTTFDLRGFPQAGQVLQDACAWR